MMMNVYLSFISAQPPRYRDTFHSFQFPIQRYDFFRYLAVHEYGGFYFDLDVLLAANLSQLLESACVFPFESLTLSLHLREQHDMDWEIGNYAFGAVKGHPFLEAVIENCVRAQRDPDWVKPMMRGAPPMFRREFRVLNTTGPGLVTRTFAECPQLAAGVRILFPNDVCDAREWNRFGDLGIHLMNGSWRTKGRFLRRKAAQYWEAWTMRRLIKQSRRLGKTRSQEP